MARERKRISDSHFTLSALMGPQEANALGNVHGGVIMKMVDEVGALVAMRHAANLVVTIAIDSMTFLEPVLVGHLVMCSAELTYVGRTSMEVRVEVVTENPLHGDPKTTNTAYLVYVAIDSNGRPCEVPEIDFESPEQQIRAEHARERQAYRKQQRALEQPEQP
ncbi:MAG: acyl-CoA thioesterase [Chloroflexota bacterium]